MRITCGCRVHFGLFLCLLCVVLPSCTLTKRATIYSSPSGAIVSLLGQELGRTPVEYEFVFEQEGEEHRLSLSSPGYFDKEIIVGYRPIDKVAYDEELEKLSKIVNVHSQPEGATVRNVSTSLRHRPKEFSVEPAQVPPAPLAC